MTADDPTLVRADDVRPEPWRNGGGRTRELLAWPSAAAWSLRISRADVERDGPFSAFPGVRRWFAVLEGAGVALTLGGLERPQRAEDPPLEFDGAAAPGCRLLAGPTVDLNLMVRGGGGAMRLAAAGRPWREPFVVRALYARVPGRWSDGERSVALGAHTLLWSAGHGGRAWSFEARAPAAAAAWWLGHEPAG